jgi:hypothetical protein
VLCSRINPVTKQHEPFLSPYNKALRLIFTHTFVLMLVSSSRLNRLGEFSPIGSLFTLDNFWKITQKPKFVDYFFQRKSYMLIMLKNVFGYILGDFFTTSSGHPENESISRKKFIVWKKNQKCQYVQV